MGIKSLKLHRSDNKIIREQLIKALTVDYNETNPVFTLRMSERLQPEIYPNSIQRLNGRFFFIGREGLDKYLYILSLDEGLTNFEKFQGDIPERDQFEARAEIKRCPLNHHNAKVVQALFDFTRPILIGMQNSIGLGDRLGLANPAHIRAVAGTPIKPLLAQQSIRELDRTERKPEEVMDAAIWAVFQEGYKDGFGADADHLKTTDDIDIMMATGFTMFTIDPSDYVVNEADFLPVQELEIRVKQLPWPELSDTMDQCLHRYEGRVIDIDEAFVIQPTREDILRALTKYGRVIAHTLKMYRHLKTRYRDNRTEIELSVDETESVTQPFEHYLVVNELTRLGVKLVSLAPRFVGDFEKGIDYKGNLNVFKKEYQKHLVIARKLGGYKISLHSGSDKFSVYDVIGSLKEQGVVHIKTAGTSYLEALKTVAKNEPDLFREILDFSRDIYHTEKVTYHVSADINRVPRGIDCENDVLLQLLSLNDTRQVLHVAFGKVLTSKRENGNFLFKDRILNCLKVNEEDHYTFLTNHMKKHIQPFLNSY